MPSAFELAVPGDGPPLLAVDFRGGRRARDFGHLLRPGSGGRPLYAAVPFGLRGTALPLPTARDYAGVYARAAAEEIGGPFAVLGYCSAGSIAHALACGLQALGERVPLLVLCDAFPAEAGDVVDAYADIVSSLSRGDGGGPEPSALGALVRAAPAHAVETARSRLSALVARSVEAAGVDGDTARSFRADLERRYAAWISFLVAAANYDPEPFDGDVHLYVSSEERRAPWPCTGETVVRTFDAPPDALLDDVAVRAALLGDVARAVPA